MYNDVRTLGNLPLQPVKRIMCFTACFRSLLSNERNHALDVIASLHLLWSEYAVTSSDENVCSVCLYLKSNESYLKLIHRTLKSFEFFVLKKYKKLPYFQFSCISCAREISILLIQWPHVPPFLRKEWKKGEWNLKNGKAILLSMQYAMTPGASPGEQAP